LSELARILCKRRIILCCNIGGKCSDATHHRTPIATAASASFVHADEKLTAFLELEAVSKPLFSF